jgi:glucose-1-phosphate cytidylyltransferase
MKVVILAGGLGTRISEESGFRPKPMVEIGGKPILWHILKSYYHHGLSDFIICCGYKGYVIKEFFANYALHMSDLTIDFDNHTTEYHVRKAESWRVTLVDTGENTMTAGRLKRVSDYLNDDENFCFTYGDGLSDVNISELIQFHEAHGKLATVTAVRPPGRFGTLEVRGGRVAKFTEKPSAESALINGGFFVMSKKCLELIGGDSTSWEGPPLEKLAQENQLMAFEHHGFWQPMDTLREKNLLDELWKSGNAPWKVW